MQFQAGLYYRLFRDFMSIEVREDAYFRGIHSNHFLTACVGFGNTLDKFFTMYDGRSKIYSPQGSPPGLIEVLGNISVLLNTLLQTTDDLAPRGIVLTKQMRSLRSK